MSLLNLRPPIFVLMSFGWLCSITLTHANSFTFYEDIIFDSRFLDLRPLFRKQI